MKTDMLAQLFFCEFLPYKVSCTSVQQPSRFYVHTQRQTDKPTLISASQKHESSWKWEWVDFPSLQCFQPQKISKLSRPHRYCYWGPHLTETSQMNILKLEGEGGGRGDLGPTVCISKHSKSSAWVTSLYCLWWIRQNVNLLKPTGHVMHQQFHPLKTKRRLLYLKTQFVPRSKHFSSRL